MYIHSEIINYHGVQLLISALFSILRFVLDEKFQQNASKGAETLVLGETGVGLFPSIYFFGVG